MVSLTFQNFIFSGVWMPPVHISNVVFTFQKSLNVWKDICLEAKHVGALYLMDQMNLNAEKNKSIWMFTAAKYYFTVLFIYVYVFLFTLLPHVVLIMYVPILL